MRPVAGTPYYVKAEPVFASDRWRFTIAAKSGPGFVHVTASAGTYRTEGLAIENGVNYARAMAKKAREDLG